MGLADVTDKHISRMSGKRCTVFAQKLPFSFKNNQTELTLDIVGMHGELLSGFKIEINDFKIG